MSLRGLEVVFSLWGKQGRALSSCAFGCAGTGSEGMRTRALLSDLLKDAFWGEALGLLVLLWGLRVTGTEM